MKASLVFTLFRRPLLIYRAVTVVLSLLFLLTVSSDIGLVRVRNDIVVVVVAAAAAALLLLLYGLRELPQRRRVFLRLPSQLRHRRREEVRRGGVREALLG